MITDAGKWLEISTSRQLSSLMTGWVSAPSNDSANDCRFYWQQAIFLPATFQAGDAQLSSETAIMVGTGTIVYDTQEWIDEEDEMNWLLEEE